MKHLLGNPHGPYPLGSFGKLSVLEVVECRSIKYLFSPSTARGLPKLQKLHIRNCRTLEEIVGGDEEVMDNVIFHQLKEMWLEFLPNLRSISSNTKKTSTTECNPSTIKQALFNEKVTCPVLEKLYILRLDSITAIWDKQLLPVQEAEDNFMHLQELNVEYCEKMEEIVAFKIGQGEEAEANDEIAVFTHLKIMELKELPNLKSFCCSYGSEKEETSGKGIPQIQAVFNHKVAFPMLEELTLFSLESIFNLEGLNAIERHKFLVFCNNLTVMDVYGCNSLRYLFSVSIATALTQLESLRISSCSIIEEIVRNEEQGPEEDGASARDKIITLFPRLVYLDLFNLPNLRSFCGGPNNIAFQLPSLGEVHVMECAEFWSTRKAVTSFFGNHIHTSLEQKINEFFHSGRPRWFYW